MDDVYEGDAADGRRLLACTWVAEIDVCNLIAR